MGIENQFDKAYKKLKSSVYYDKTQLVLRDKIVKYESENDLSKRFNRIAEILNGTDKKWNQYKNKLTDSIEVLAFPKKIAHEEETIIMNVSKTTVALNELQYFLDMDVEGQFLGVLWCLFIGTQVDKSLYEHSYGNRIKNNVISDDGIVSSSPYLFRQYFEQYESWRDKGLDIAQETLRKNNDVIIVTMDFTRYFYSLNICEERYNKLYETLISGSDLDCRQLQRIHEFVYEVIKIYSKKLKTEGLNVLNALPIGFYPSYVLSNWYLDNFDKAMCDRWNPLYYGRYVDDIIIIDKIEKGSEIYKKAIKDELDRDNVLNYYLCNCNAIKSNKCINNTSLLYETKDTSQNQIQYHINKDILNDPVGDIEIKNDKVKIFYFRENNTDALIDCFRKVIARNKSEFRFLPEDQSILQYDDYSDIYKIVSKDTINKLRGVSDIQLDKYELSKFLGKYLRISTLIDDKKELKFEKDIQQIFDNRTIVDNYTSWEKILEVLILDNKFDALIKFVDKILFAITNIKYINNNTPLIKKSLLLVLRSALNRSMSLCWGKDIGISVENIEKLFDKYENESLLSYKGIFSATQINKYRKYYCKTRMCDKNAVPLIVDAIFSEELINNLSDNENKINLSKFSECLAIAKNLELINLKYKYFPYTISPQDIEICLILNSIQKQEELESSNDISRTVKTVFKKLNGFELKNYIDVITKDINELSSNKHYTSLIKINNEKKQKCHIAIANVKLSIENMEKLLIDTPNRSYDRYKQAVKLINDAIKNKVNILVLPEAFLPFEWLPIVARTCAKVNLAIITGVEHLKCDKKVYNLTATILPYRSEDYAFSYINLRNKVHYAPDEKLTIESYGFNIVAGKEYSLFNWNDIWFPVYCCYELTSILDRSIFMSLADILIAVEWNHDVNYYSNIIESLSRDLHCFCVQVNTSDYGDSRITRPSQTVNKDIVRTKGGKNSTILTDTIDILGLRKFQIKGYSLQKQDKSYKPTPPQFEYENVRKKIIGTLWEELKL